MDISDVVICKMSQAFTAKYPTQEFIPMDATSMPLRDNSYDICFDKGTYDALACGESSKPILTALTLEMVRVCKTATIIISSGTPEKRVPFLTEFIKEAGIKCAISAQKIELSRLATLINILRSEMKDKPLSHAMKDQKTLKRALMEMVNIERTRIEGVTDPKKKLLALMLKAKQKKEREEKEAKEALEAKENPGLERPGYDPHR